MQSLTEVSISSNGSQHPLLSTPEAQPYRLPALRTVIRGLGKATRTLAAVVREWRQRAEGRSYLARMDQHMLKDIGASRAEVFREQAKWFWQP
jgi:uncharacterized protein YjiS (DUF1127 family)